MRKFIWFLTVLAGLGVGAPIAGHAQATFVCNEANETLYVAVRHNAPSLFTANSRTEGWWRLPTRSALRSCTSFSRYARDHYIVAGVMRNGEIVPVRFQLSGFDVRREIYVCVPTSTDNFEYRSDAVSDESCYENEVRARISAGVLGGDRDVSINLSGDTSHIGQPSPPTVEPQPDLFEEITDMEIVRGADFNETDLPENAERVANWSNYLSDLVIVTRQSAATNDREFSYLYSDRRLSFAGAIQSHAAVEYSETFFQEHCCEVNFEYGWNMWTVEIFDDIPMLCFYSHAWTDEPYPVACSQLIWNSDDQHPAGGTLDSFGHWLFAENGDDVDILRPDGFPVRINDIAVLAR